MHAWGTSNERLTARMRAVPSTVGSIPIPVVVFQAVNVRTGLILPQFQAGFFLAGKGAVGPGPPFGVLDPVLLPDQVTGFAAREFPALDAMNDAFVLPDLSMGPPGRPMPIARQSAPQLPICR